MSAAPHFDPSIGSADLALTDAASAQLVRLFGEVEDDEIQAIRIYVTGGGCSGMAYGMTFTDRRTAFDRVLEGDGFSIYVDAVAMQFMSGAEIDYVTRETGATFVFNNVFQSTGGSGMCGGCGAAGRA
jgi:iron-sulfur cluster insertion protein